MMARLPIVLDCSCWPACDASDIARLAALQVALRRRGCELRLRNAPPQLIELIAFFGLLDVLRVESGGETEEREKPVRLEEERESGDAAV
jgi:anti-anti-sigma regulatory factor